MGVVAKLIQKGANVNIRNKNTDGALTLASGKGYIYDKKIEKEHLSTLTCSKLCALKPHLQALWESWGYSFRTVQILILMQHYTRLQKKVFEKRFNSLDYRIKIN